MVLRYTHVSRNSKKNSTFIDYLSIWTVILIKFITEINNMHLAHRTIILVYSFTKVD